MSRKDTAWKWLANPEACAATLYLSARTLFGDEVDDYEPEALRMECAEHGVEMPEENWDALMAVIALRVDGRFFLEAEIFEATTLAFNDHAVDPGVYQHAEPGWVGWAVQEADELAQDILPEGESAADYLDYEPVSYAAVTCQYNGMVCVPPCLEFCSERLTELTPHADDLRAEVKKAWAELDMTKLRDHAFDESDVGVQLANMAAAHLYVTERSERLRAQLSSF